MIPGDTVLLVGLGGAVGALCRHGVYRLVTVGQLPAATFVVNVIGSLLLGLLVLTDPENTILLLGGVGFCGAFTTFSTFAVETIDLYERGDRRVAVGNAIVTLVTAVGAIALLWVFLGA